SEYARPIDKLSAERLVEPKKKGGSFQPQEKLSRSNLPSKEDFLDDVRNALEQSTTFALLVVDLDHFKAVNDTKGHLAGDDCLDLVIATIGVVVGRRGKIYRWGGDEFAVYLPDFVTIEALTTAERIRSAVEKARPGGEIEVTTSVGV